MKIIVFDDYTRKIKREFFNLINSSQYKSLTRFSNIINLCPYEVVLITKNEYKLSNILQKENDFFANDIDLLHQSWYDIQDTETNNARMQNNNWETINKIGRQIIKNPLIKSNYIYQFRKQLDDDKFFILLPEKINNFILLNNFIFLSYLWQIRQSRVPIHASVILQSGGMYLFGGPSGSGKSTIARLSKKIGASIIDDDQVLLTLGPEGKISAHAWGYSSQNCDIPLVAVFKIIKDETNCLFRLSETRTARFLFEQSFQVTGNQFPNIEQIILFKNISKISRHIPGFALHFQKSPDFWKLIKKADHDRAK